MQRLLGSDDGGFSLCVSRVREVSIVQHRRGTRKIKNHLLYTVFKFVIVHIH